MGAWDGFFSFEAERRGAKRVLATDSFSWRGGAGVEGRVRACARSGWRISEVDVLDLDGAIGRFDLVLFSGCLTAHLPRSSGWQVTGEQLIETHIERFFGVPPLPYPDAELNQDPPSWFGPT